MVRHLYRLSVTAVLVIFLQHGGFAQSPAIYSLLPESTQAVVWIPDSNDFINRWNRTTLHKLSEDPAIRPFFQEQQEIIQSRLMEVGWRLGVKPQELVEYFTGEIAVAWLEQPDERKPFALAMVADIDDDSSTANQLLEDIDRALKSFQPGKKMVKYLDQEVTQYTLPRRPGQLLDENTYVAITSGKVLVSDELAIVKDLIARVLDHEVNTPTLAEDADFISSRENLGISGRAQLEYFFRPLGIARVIRAISGKRSKSGADILAVLKNQGFTSIKCLAGELWLAQADTDIAHQGFVLAEFPLPRSAGVLDFPNESMLDVPSFVSGRAASFLAISWNAQTAFWKVRELVDEMVGNQGVFDEVINGIKNDVNGPQIDIKTEVLPLLTNDILAITDNQEGEIDVNSRRNMIAVKVNDFRKATQVLDRVMKAEANAELLEHRGVSIWKVTNEKNSFDAEEFSEFGDFSDPDENGEEPWLNQWAICVLKNGDKEGYFIFASHTEMLQDAISQSLAGEKDNLRNQADYQRIYSAIMTLMNDQRPCAWKISRNHIAYEVQYELFRQGKLQESESMLATILDRLIGVDSESDQSQQRQIDGQSLPAFQSIAPYLKPSGFKVRTTDSGWHFGGLLLGESNTESEELSGNYQFGTARIVDSTSDSKR
jgi:hypothetical protein